MGMHIRCVMKIQKIKNSRFLTIRCCLTQRIENIDNNRKNNNKNNKRVYGIFKKIYYLRI